MSTTDVTLATRGAALAFVRSERLPAVLVGSITIAWTALWLGVAIDRHETIRSHRFDLGNMVQAVWSTAHGRPLDVTLASGEQANRLGIHVDPILAAFAPLWWLFPTPLLLIVVQALALALGVVPVYLLGRKHLESAPATVAMCLVYLAFPSVAWNVLNDFHPVTLAIPLLLAAVWFLDEDRLLAFAICAVAALMTNELIGLGIGALGAWYALDRGRRLAGLLIAIAGIGWTVICLKLVIPAFSGGSSVFYDRFGEVGGSPGGLARTALSDPGTVLAALTEPPDISYVLALIASLLGIFLLSPLALVAVPQLLVNLLAEQYSPTHLQYQYVAGVFPFLLAASVFGLRKIGQRWRPLVAIAMVGASCFALIAVLPTATGADRFVYAQRDDDAHLDAIRAALALVPDHAAVSATNRIGGQLSERRRVFSFPVREAAGWVIVDRRDPWLAIGGAEGDATPLFENALRDLVADAGFTRVFARDDVEVYRRS